MKPTTHHHRPWMVLVEVLNFLKQDGPKSIKHRQWIHPLTVLIVHYAVAITVTIVAHDILMMLSYDSQIVRKEQQRTNQTTVAIGLAVYLCCYFSARIVLARRSTTTTTTTTFVWCECYRQTFLCSVTLVLSSIGLWSGRPIVASAHIVAVGIDQLLWYIDLTVYAITGSFPIGCTRYLFWDGTTWCSRLTSTHHLWTIPLILWTCRECHICALPLSIVVVVTNVLLSRWLTPIRIEYPNRELQAATQTKKIRLKSISKQDRSTGNITNRHGRCNDDYNDHDDDDHDNAEEKIHHSTTTVYLNLNLAHELWTDIPFKFLRWGEGRIPYLIRLFFVWCIVCNTAVYCVLVVLSQLIFSI